MRSTKIIIALIVIIVVAGAVYYGLQDKNTQPQASEEIVPAKEGAVLSADQKAALDFPSESASPGEIKKHLEAVEKIAEDTNALEITNCALKPLVLRADVGSEINVFNGSDSAAILEFGNQKFNIPAGENLAIKASFPPGGGGLYGYSCNVSSAPEGFPGTATGIFMLVSE